MIRLPATAPMAPTEPSLPLSSSAGPSTLLRAVLVPFFTRAPAAPLSVARSLAKLDDAEPFYRPIVDYAVDWNVAKGRGKTRKIPPAAQKEFVALLRESADFSELWAFTPDERPRVRKLTEAQMAKKPAQDVSTDKSSGDQQPLRFGGAVDPNLPATQRERSEAPEVLLELESGAGEQGIIIDTQASLDADDDAELEAEGVGSDDHQAGAIDSIMAEYAGLEEDFE
ncbi:hypothetical protein DFJ74DRAFT_692847 [Hyaloraphidium curvatum]|nr:hypothetical protein DFJ74DRAFT_692847 [Hyaloraphidium curvatum]